MKRVLICVLSAVMILTLGGCSSKSPETTKQEGNIVEIGNSGAQEVSLEMVKYFGKVKKVVGNEIELELAKEVVIELIEGEELPEGVGIASVGELPGGAEVPSGEITSSVAVSEISPEDVEKFKDVDGGESMTQVIMPNGNGEKMELEYTGETKTLIIPAGASIFNFVAGKEGKVTDIKEGSVLMIYADGKGESPVVSNVEIRE